MKITEQIQAEIKAIKERLDTLSSELEKCENKQDLSIWQPKKKEEYFYIGSDCRVYSDINGDLNYEKMLFDCGNDFKTKEEAEFEAQREKYTRLFRKYVKEHNTEFGNNGYYAYWNKSDKKIDIGNNSIYVIRAFEIYGDSEEVVQNAIKFIGEDNFKKYILEIGE